MSAKVMWPQFVDIVPDVLQDGILYICLRACVVLHLCACGCREEVVTPISPKAWRFTFDGCSVSLRPSIGNWKQQCRSHYWITRDRIEWVSECGRRDKERPESPLGGFRLKDLRKI